MFKYELGEILKDKVTGFIGIIMGRTEYTTGCLQYGLVSRKLDRDGNPLGWHWIDEVRLKSTNEKIEILKDDSGPAPPAPEIN